MGVPHRSWVGGVGGWVGEVVGLGGRGRGSGREAASVGHQDNWATVYFHFGPEKRPSGTVKG